MSILGHRAFRRGRRLTFLLVEGDHGSLAPALLSHVKRGALRVAGRPLCGVAASRRRVPLAAAAQGLQHGGGSQDTDSTRLGESKRRPRRRTRPMPWLASVRRRRSSRLRAHASPTRCRADCGNPKGQETPGTGLPRSCARRVEPRRRRAEDEESSASAQGRHHSAIPLHAAVVSPPRRHAVAGVDPASSIASPWGRSIVVAPAIGDRALSSDAVGLRRRERSRGNTITFGPGDDGQS